LKTRSEGIIVLGRGLPVFNDEEMRIGGRQDGTHARRKDGKKYVYSMLE
jgi:hypothetical protein